MKRYLLKLLFNVFGALLTIGGAFVAVAGAVGGFGATTAIKRLEVTGIGLIALVVGLYSLYRAADKSWAKVIENLLTTLFINT